MQAILISAYKDQDYLKRLINFFDDNFEIFIHIDKKSNINPHDIKINQNVHVYKKFLVNWGSFNHLQAIFFLMEKALKFSQAISYIHIISGSDMPVKKVDDFKVFEGCKQIYMEHMNVVRLNSEVINRRYQYGNRLPNTDARKRYARSINKLYEIFHKPKSNIGEFQSNQLYKGLVWLSLPREAAEYVVNYASKNNFMAKMRHITVPEEFFFQTILENSFFKSNIASNNLRYNDWSKVRHGSLPAILDESDYKKIVSGSYFFARKVDKNISKKLVNKISIEINNF